MLLITNDGATILTDIAVQHPGAKMVIEVAIAQDDEVGDGTTTAVVLVGALMEQAELLIAKKIHPTIIGQGYRMGMEKALEIIDDLSISIDPFNRDILLKIAETAMTGESIESVKGKLDGIVDDAVMLVAEKNDGEGVRLVMADGQIVREDRIGSPLEEDLKMWRHSGLGQQVFAGDHEQLQALGISAHQIEDVKAILELADGG